MQTHKLLSVLVAAALLASTLLVAAEADAVGVGVNPHVYGDTTIYELDDRALNITASINSIETTDNQTITKVSVRILSPTYDARGEVLSLDQYHRWKDAGVLQYYLLGGLTVDFDRETSIGRIWPVSSNLTGIELDNSIAAFYSHTTYFALDQNQDTFSARVVMPKLSEGEHNVTFWASLKQNYLSFSGHVWAAFYKTVTFTVDTTAPDVTVVSPANTSYVGVVPLDFSVNESTSKISHSVDGQANVTVAGNVTLTDLAAGWHNVTVYAWDEAGNVGKSETTGFSVEESSMLTTETAVAIAVVVAATVLAVFLVIRRLRKSLG